LLSFASFRLDLSAERLWQGEQEVHLRRKPFAILRHLVHNPQRLVTHDEIIGVVWGKIAMSESLLRTHVRDLRHVLGEGVVETVVGRGYRFLPELKHVELERQQGDWAASTAQGGAKVVVGRDTELEALRAALRSVRDRRRTTVFITGEAGSGKTTLVDLFVEQAAAQSRLLVGRGACVEQYGSGQAYLPVLDAIGALCRGTGADQVIEVLATHAPTWLVQLPSLIRPNRLDELQRRASGATQARSLRELAEALEALCVEAPVAIVFDDLQWTDPSTAEVLAFLGSRREPARLLVLGVYRSEEVPRGHPLMKVAAELIAHRQASSIGLEGLSTDSVDSYLTTRYHGHSLPPELTRTLHRTTGGNPLFLTTLVDDLEAQDLLSRRGGRWELTTSVDDVAARRPDSIRRLIDTQIDRLGAAEQRIVEAAGIAGMIFTAGEVAHALDADPDYVDSACESLANERRLLQYLGSETWPDGTIQSRYAFAHALFQHAALARSTGANVRSRHRKIAERLELGYVGKEEDVAAELAVHFGQGQGASKAAHYHVIAGDRAGRQLGLKEAIAHFDSARALIAGLPASRERDALELRSLLGLGLRRFQAYGSADEAIPTLQRASKMAIQLDDKATLVDVLVRLEGMHLMRGELREVEEIATALAPVLPHATDPLMPRLARQVEATAVLLRGRFEEAGPLFDALGALRIEDPEAADVHVLGRGMGCFLFSWLTGRPDQALALARSAERVAARIGIAYEHAAILSERAVLHAWRREPAEAEEVARRALAISEEGSFGVWENRAQMVLRWARAELDVEMPRDRADDLLSKPLDIGSLGRTTIALLYVSMCARLGRREKALELITSTLEFAERSDERWLEPEFHRLRGELFVSSRPAEATRSMATAIEIARSQGSRLFELRATLSVHAHATGTKKKRAREDIARLLSVITEGHETSDLIEARAVVQS
jgi:DNA-binding winged helix-turn-helix (wHTH) protein/tetratricopeptide (TPR) repeat protein